MSNIKKILGLSLLEALISTAIVGIGFIAILQMTNYSVQSIYTSGERTKANYLTNMIAEDVIGHRDITTGDSRNFSDWLASTNIVSIQQKVRLLQILATYTALM